MRPVEEPSTHSFIVKIWLEETAREARRVRWRGHITHVPGGERRYLQDLAGVNDFIAPYLEEMGVRGARRGRLRGWFGQWVRALVQRKDDCWLA